MGLYDQGHVMGLIGLGHVGGWEPCNLHHLGQVSSVLSCTDPSQHPITVDQGIDESSRL